ncbi:MAG: carboxypeptidase regulatory-like domain-containing protein [Patescibacteria group bacterium]
MQKRIANFGTEIIIAFVLTWIIGYQPATATAFGSITGKVYNKHGGGGVPYAIVQIDRTTLGCQADINGTFEMLNVPPGRYSLTAQLAGWCTKKVPYVIVKPDSTTHVKIQMNEATTDGEIHFGFRRTADIVGFWPLEGTDSDSGSFGSIEGLCQGAFGREPLIGLVIQINDQEFRAESDSLGGYILANIPAGIYTLTVYENETQWITVKNVRVRTQKKTIVDFSLEYEEYSDDPCK